MSFERCAATLIYVFLASLNLSSARAASMMHDSTAAQDTAAQKKVTLAGQQSDDSDFAAIALRGQDNLRLPQSSPDITLKLAQTPTSDSEAATDAAPASEEFIQTKSDVYWALGAMALTSGIALFLLWLLFKKPQDSQITPEITTVASLPVAKKTALDSPDLPPDNKLASERRSTPSTQMPKIDVVHELLQDLQLEQKTGNDISEVSPSNQSVAELQASRRRKAIWELAKTGDYRSIEPLLKIMPEAPETDKSLIVEAISQITSRSLKPINRQLFANLQHSNPEVRLNAVRDLKHLYQFVTPAIAKIALMQSDPDYQVRQTAIQALKYLNADPLPTFTQPVAKNHSSEAMNNLVSGEDSKANLHLVAYLLAELDADNNI